MTTMSIANLQTFAVCFLIVATFLLIGVGLYLYSTGRKDAERNKVIFAPIWVHINAARAMSKLKIEQQQIRRELNTLLSS